MRQWQRVPEDWCRSAREKQSGLAEAMLAMAEENGGKNREQKNTEQAKGRAFGGANRQVELLKAEGVGFLDDSHVDMKHCCVRALPLILDE